MNNQILADVRLKLHLDYPDLEECYVDGFACSLAGLSEETNPYAPDSIEGNYWTDGWWAAFYDEKPLFNLEGPTVEVSQPKPHEHHFSDYFVTFLEISGILAVSALVGYQLWDFVA